MKDRDDHAARMRQHIIAEAGKHQPGLVSVQVSGNAEAAELGWVWGTHAGANVRVIVGNGLDVSNGQHVLRCIPPDDNHPSDEYYAIGVDWNGVDDSRVPRMTYMGSDGNQYSGAHTHSEYAAASHTHTAGSITDLFATISGYIQPGTGMVFSYAGTVITIHNTATGAGGTGGAGGSATDESVTTGTAGVALAHGERVFVDGAGLWQKFDCSATSSLGAYRGLVRGSIASGATGLIQILGVATGLTGLSIGSAVWATGAGGYTQTKPSPVEDQGQLAIDRIGFAVDTTKVMMQPELVVMMCEVLADDEEMTLVHPVDDYAPTRNVGALSKTISYGSDLIDTGSSVISSAAWAGYPDDNVADGDNDTVWWEYYNTGAGANGVNYIGYDFGASNDKDIRRVIYRNPPAAGWSEFYAPTSVKIQYSDNGSDWSDVRTYSGLDTAVSATNTLNVYASAGSHRYWRLLANSDIYYGWAAAELQMFELDTEVYETMMTCSYTSEGGDVAVRFDDGSYGSLATQTTMKNVTGSTKVVVGTVRID